MAVRTGIEMLVQQGSPLLKGKRIGVICNQASTGPAFVHTVDLLASMDNITIGALLGPEHGVRGEAQDMIAVSEGGAEGTIDRKTGAPVHSLYGDTYDSLTPTPEMLKGLEAIVFDMQDVGARYYTFYATMVLAMGAAKKAGLPFIVLDRPNPLGGEMIEGGLQEPGYLSFVGLFPMPVRHGLTVGEIAQYANRELHINCDLAVIPMHGWKRSMLWEETGLPFIPPSPNMPTPDTARVYPGLCLVEGTNLSEARGSTRPFEQNGAPFLDPEKLAARLNGQKLAGVHFRPCYYRPTFHKFAQQDCGAIFIHVTDAKTFQPYRAGLAFIEAAQALARDRFKWRTEKYEFVDTIPAFDLLTGTPKVREAFDRGESIEPLWEQWHAEEEEFRRRRKQYLLYA